jgi:ribosome-associated heat shock protein Hsp15
MTNAADFDSPEICRADVWLWRARFFKTRGLAARVIQSGGVRVTRGGQGAPIDKASRQVRAGDVIAFPLGPKYLAARVEALGARRGPASEARQLYTLL